MEISENLFVLSSEVQGLLYEPRFFRIKRWIDHDEGDSILLGRIWPEVRYQGVYPDLAVLSYFDRGWYGFSPDHRRYGVQTVINSFVSDRYERSQRLSRQHLLFPSRIEVYVGVERFLEAFSQKVDVEAFRAKATVDLAHLPKADELVDHAVQQVILDNNERKHLYGLGLELKKLQDHVPI